MTSDGYLIALLNSKDVYVSAQDLAVYRFDFFPIWETVWTFKHLQDKEWVATEDGLYTMASCGFRVYKQEELGYVFGIDGAGYDFHEKHWLPLYRRRCRE